MLLNLAFALGGAVATVVSQTVYNFVKSKVVAPVEAAAKKL